MRHLVYAGPDDLAVALKGLSVKQLVERAGALRPQRSPDQVTASTKLALHTLAGRVHFLDDQLGDLDQFLAPLVSRTAPALLELVGVGPLTAATLLVVAGDNPERLRSEAAWAHLCGVAPLEASSGKVVRHRLDPGRNHQANSALWRIVMVRLSCDLETQAYMERRSKDGRSKREVVRSLKRYVAREVYRTLALQLRSPSRGSDSQPACHPRGSA
jgi:transposase